MSDVEAKLCALLKKKEVEIVWNQNQSTMLSLLRGPGVRLSLHEIFAKAPDNVLKSVAHFALRGRRDRAYHKRVLRTFIHEQLSEVDHTSKLDVSRLSQRGKFYDLQVIYDRVNREYFNSELQLLITWESGWGWNNLRSITFGQYHDTFKLIRIHEMLDAPFFPAFFVEFVVYHEMVHAVVPGTFDAYGRCRLHGPAFKARERQYARYKEAVAWQKENKQKLFRGTQHGRT